MSRFLLFFSQVVLLSWTRISSQKNELTCRNINDYNVCHYKAVLIKVTQRSSEDGNFQLKISDLALQEIHEDASRTCHNWFYPMVDRDICAEKKILPPNLKVCLT
ncbi:uncharacterized protein LOC105430438 [Pogonomyrmex barbatus]|uniref:Uncharacterized protein LOC105430438 n=1 Tax=Pogonomyrmex barbatus TaxID=144034 RepID=A0A6I9XBT0_9HYME|nr:uncharacterized protein LOC105430438 [Pogonomyrmex barbatus]